MKKYLLPLAFCAALVGCDQAPGNKNEGSAQPPAASAASSAENLQGHWTGPEGTYLDLQISEGTDKTVVKIRNLDGERTFDGSVAAGIVTFERDGATETVRTGNGQDTGMKWLADKKDCLVVKTGEGYCRD